MRVDISSSRLSTYDLIAGDPNLRLAASATLYERDTGAVLYILHCSTAQYAVDAEFITRSKM